MILYDKMGKPYEFNISDDNKIGSGRNAKVYRTGEDECLKVMNKDPDNYFRENIYNVFESLSLPSFVKINKLFYIGDKIKAYTMEYLEHTDKSILDMPTEYTLDNMNSLYKDLLELSKYFIYAFDLYHKNVILKDDGITIIDYDSYKESNTQAEALFNSLWNLMYTFRRLYEEELKKKGIDVETTMIGDMSIVKYLSKYLFNYDYSNYFKNPSEVLERKLVGTRTPMDLFRRKW